MTQPVFRFAPSPNGRLHLGHAYSALLNAKFACETAGRLLLRIEDIDHTRARPEYEAGIYEDLGWLGLAWETPVRRQSEHLDDYRAALQRLRGKELVYPCFCSRRDIATAISERPAAAIWPRDPDGSPLYPGTCRGLSPAAVAMRVAAGEPHAWRLDMAAARAFAPDLAYTRFGLGQVEPVTARPERWGDAVVARKDIGTSYHLAVVADDATQGVTHVVRGQDLEAATDLHRFLQALLELPTPSYHHHRLIRDERGGKLSKSLASRALADLRSAGTSAAEVRRSLGFHD